ncbi:MAG: hypothetical protein NVSMB62_10350 [Acidobacteriaceae bacterium]
MDSSEADCAATFWLISEPRTAQVPRKSVTENRARRVREAISFSYLDLGAIARARAAVRGTARPGSRERPLLVGRV